MDLRGSSQMHFISIIRGGEVIKVPNIVQGKPAPKLMSIEGIYSSIDSKSHHSCARYLPKVNRSLAMLYSFEIKTKVKVECTEEDELDFGATTLRQLKDICKSRKRKASRSVDLTAVKEEDNDFQCEEDGLDLKETLGSWRRKVHSIRTKARKKSISSSKFCEPLKIKIEDAEHEHSELQARSLTLHDKPANLTHHTVRAVEHCCSDQDMNVISGNMQSGYLNQHSNEHFVHSVSIEKSICCFNKASYEHLDYNEPLNSLIFKNQKDEESMKVESSAVIGDQSLFSCGSNVRRMEDKSNLMIYDVPTEKVLFECDNSDFGDHYLQHAGENTSSGSEISVPCVGPNGDCQNAEITTFGEATGSADGYQYIEGEVLRKPATNCSSVVNSDNHFSSSHGMASLDRIATAVEDGQSSVLTITTEEVSVPPLVPESDCLDTELSNYAETSISFADNPVTEAKALRRDWKNCEVALQDENYSPLVNCIVTSSEGNNQSSTLDDAYSPEIQPCAAIDQEIGSGETEGHYENKLLQQPPENLFSARKTFSPTSKENLCKAMDLTEMQDDNQVLSCKEKLSFEKNCVDSSSSRTNPKKARIILTSKRMEALHTTEIRASTKQKNHSFVKGTGRGVHGSPSLHAGNKCNSSLSCSQNAIAFSQQQMLDIERLATKLLAELHSMKEIVVDSLHPESRTCTTLKSSTDKARIAVENVKKVEETTKRWLSIMSRDCHRFCKILEVAEKNNSSPEMSTGKCTPENVQTSPENPSSEIQQDSEELSPSKSTVNREKKIMFADEAGDSLCQIRVLETKD
ncbi:E3 SUMO-protein ligase RanBP2 [Bienertia sinuspersici]